MVELPDDLVEAVAKAIAADRGQSAWSWDDLLDGTKLVFRHHAEVALRPAYPLIAAHVRAEAVAERDAIIEVIQQYLPEALPFNTLPEIVGGIARQRDFQHELKDHLAEVARRLTDERDAAVAEAVAGERQRLADLILPDHWQTMQLWGGVQRLACGRCRYGDGVRFLWPCPTRRAITGEAEPEADSARLAAATVPVATGRKP